MLVISSLSVSLLCVSLHCTVSSAYTSVLNLATHMCHFPYSCHLHAQWARLRHTKVACHIHVSFALALTETRRPGSLFYFIVFHRRYLPDDDHRRIDVALPSELLQSLLLIHGYHCLYHHTAWKSCLGHFESGCCSLTASFMSLSQTKRCASRVRCCMPPSAFGGVSRLSFFPVLVAWHCVLCTERRLQNKPRKGHRIV